MLNSHYLFVIYLDYIENMLKESNEIKQKWFLEDKYIYIYIYIKIYINALKIEWNKRMCQVVLNESIYAKQKIT